MGNLFLASYLGALCHLAALQSSDEAAVSIFAAGRMKDVQPPADRRFSEDMATYEVVLEEIRRMTVVDGFDREDTVIEYVERLHRISVTKKYSPLRGRTLHRLADGRDVRLNQRGFFSTPDAETRYFPMSSSTPSPTTG